MKDEINEWKHIEVYYSGKSDMISTILSHFESNLPADVVKWLKIERDISLREVEGAIARTHKESK